MASSRRRGLRDIISPAEQFGFRFGFPANDGVV
jgi:hypothetical protein